MKEGRAISPALLHPRPPKLTGNPACLHTSPSNVTLATLPRESKEPCRRRSTSLHTSKRVMISVHIAALVSQRHSSTKQMPDVGSAPSTLMSSYQALPFSHGLFLECLVYPPGLLAVKGHTLPPP